MHSYGGVPGSNAVQGLTVADRARKGKKGGVTHVFYCCAWMLPLGKTISDMYSAERSNKRVRSNKVHELTAALGGPEKCFYGDVDREQKEAAMAQLKTHAYDVIYGSICTFEPWKVVPCTYLLCAQDGIIAYEMQQGVVEYAKKHAAADLRTVTLESSHSPFLSMPDKVTAAIRQAAGETGP